MRLSPKRALLVCLALLVAVLAASLLLLSQAYLWFAPSAALLGVALSYPMWSWRSQEPRCATWTTNCAVCSASIRRC